MQKRNIIDILNSFFVEIYNRVRNAVTSRMLLNHKVFRYLRQKLLKEIYYQKIKAYVQTSPSLRLMRLDKPHAYILLISPLWWTILISHLDFFTTLFYMILFFLGGIVMRSAGCIINDIIDRKIDAKTKRTNQRPLANNECSLAKALYLLLTLLIVATFFLFFLTKESIILSFLTVLGIILYPFAKYLTNLPQLVLGIVFNMGVWIAWYTLHSSISIIPVLIYVSSIIWTVSYDTVYAFQDYQDDKKNKVKTILNLVGNNHTHFLTKICQIQAVCIWFAGYIAYMNMFYSIIILYAFFSLYYKIQNLNPHIKKDCEDFFKYNALFATIITIAMLIGQI